MGGSGHENDYSPSVGLHPGGRRFRLRPCLPHLAGSGDRSRSRPSDGRLRLQDLHRGSATGPQGHRLSPQPDGHQGRLHREAPDRRDHQGHRRRPQDRDRAGGALAENHPGERRGPPRCLPGGFRHRRGNHRPDRTVPGPGLNRPPRETNMRAPAIRHTALFLSLTFAGIGPALAAETANASTLEAESARVDAYAVGHASTVENRISNSFTSFAGSSENASALTYGLREGTPINLLSTAPDGSTTITSFTPATGSMGYGNVRISMALAQQQLAGLGITNPTPEQLAAALNGGRITYVAPNGVVTTTEIQGVLQLRAAGQGWGQISQAYGTRLGPVISGLKSTQAPAPPPVVTPARPIARTAPAGTASTVRVSDTTAGKSGGNHGSAASPGYGRGIVTAYGTSPSGVVDANPGKGHAYGASAQAATATPVSANAGGTASGISTANGNGQGNAYGQGKAHGKN